MMETMPASKVDRMLAEVVARATDVLPLDAGGIALYDQVTQTLSFKVYISGGELQFDYFPRIAVDEGIVGRVAQTRQPQLVSEIEPGSDRLKLNPNTRAELAVPLIFDDHLLGVFKIESDVSDAFTETHLRILSGLAQEAVVVLGDYLSPVMLRQSEAFRRIAALSVATFDFDELCSSVTREIAGLLNVGGVLFFFPDADGKMLRVHDTSAYGEMPPDDVHAWSLSSDSLVVQVFKSHKPFFTREAAKYLGLPADLGIEQILMVPLLARGETLGVLAVANPEGDDFDPGYLDILQPVADHIALTIQNARLFDAERRRADMMALINQIGHRITARLDLDDLMLEIAEAIHKKLGYSAVHLLTLEPDRCLVVRAVAASPAHPVEVGFTFSADRGVSGRALRTQQGQLVPDVRRDPDYFMPDSFDEYKSCFTVPLKFADQVLGVLDILSTRYNAFDGVDREAIETLANQVAIVIDNAMHYAREHRRRELAERHQAAAQVISRQLQLHALLNLAVREASRLFDLPAAAIMSFDPDTQTLYGNAAYGLSPEYMRLRRVQVEELPDWAIRETGQILYYADLREIAGDDPEQIGLIEQEDLTSMLAVPMKKGTKYIGSLNLYARGAPRTFSEGEIEVAQLFANRVAIAIDNVRLFEALEVHAQELSQANRLKSEFLANISHELRTPMNAIIGFSEAMMNGLYGSVTEKQIDRLGSILRNARNLLNLIEDLLDISRIGANRLQLNYEAVPIFHELKAAIERYRPKLDEKGLEMRVDIDHLPPVRGDVVRLRQVLDNLFSNAIKFTEEGYVGIQAYVHRHDGRAWVRCAVKDSGIGISLQDQAIVFDEFRQVDGTTTREYGGTGLGLAITKKLVEMMGGKIWVTSDGVPGEGSTFTFELPVVT